MKHLIALVTAVAAMAISALAQVQDECWSGDWDRRIAACTELIAKPGLDPQSLAAAHASRGLALSRMGQHNGAIRDYDEAIRLVPDFSIALNNRAWSYFRSGRAEQGRQDIERSLRLNPKSPRAYDTRAHIRQRAGDQQGALEDYAAAILKGGERIIELYQCGLQHRGLYSGPVDGVWTSAARSALVTCIADPHCDPLPPNEVCQPAKP